jgi:hypothetical protein
MKPRALHQLQSIRAEKIILIIPGNPQNMKRLFIFSAIALISYFIGSCYYDNEEALYPQLDTNCDTTNVTFSVTIVKIMSDNCYSCHSNANAATWGNNVRLEDYPDVSVDAPHIQGAIKHEPGHNPMPKNGGKISDCSITQFDIWVRNGTPNN